MRRLKAPDPEKIFVHFLYRMPAFDAFDDFDDFVESTHYKRAPLFEEGVER